MMMALRQALVRMRYAAAFAALLLVSGCSSLMQFFSKKKIDGIWRGDETPRDSDFLWLAPAAYFK